MKNSMEIYQERLQLILERRMLNNKLKKNEDDLLSLKKTCPHDLVLVFDDHMPHKVGTIYRCLCPVCGKKKNIYSSRDFKKCEFKDSKFINLTSLSMDNFNETYDLILSYIFGHHHYCFDENHSEIEIEKSIKQYLNQEKKHIKVLKK